MDTARVDVKGCPITVIGDDARRHLEGVNADLARMKMALHRIMHMNPDEWGKQGIYRAQAIAKEGLA